jgi:hypothetical protein
VGVDRLPELGAGLVPALPVVLGPGQGGRGGLAAGAAHGRLDHARRLVTPAAARGAESSMFFTVGDGRIAAQENFDRSQPPGT